MIDQFVQFVTSYPRYCHLKFQDPGETLTLGTDHVIARETPEYTHALG